MKWKKNDSLVSWKTRPDIHTEEDNINHIGDNITEWDEHGSPSLVGPPNKVTFIMKDETNAQAMRAMKMKRWF